MSNDLIVLEKQLAPLAPRFAEVLPATIKPDRLIRTVLVSVERLPKLLQCDRQSLFNAAMSAAILGLEVDGVTGQAFLIPFKGKAQLVVGYKGYNTIAARAGITITGSVVREGDEFDFDKGEGWVKHKPHLGKPGRITAAWAKAAAHGRPSVIEVLSIDDLMAVKARSPAVKNNADTPWNDTAIGFPAMCEKTVKRRLARALPLTMMQSAARIDEAVDEQGKPAWISPERGVVVDGEVIDPAPTPTVAQLIGLQRGDAAGQAPAPASPEVSPGAGAGITIPEWQEYVERWAVMLDEASDAKQLHALWGSETHKMMRREIIWPDIGTVEPDPLDALTKRVTAKIAALKPRPAVTGV